MKKQLLGLLPHLLQGARKPVKKVQQAPAPGPIVAARGQPSEISGQEFEVRGQEFEIKGKESEIRVQVVLPKVEQEPLEVLEVSMYGRMDDVEEGVYKEETQKKGASQ